MVRTLGELSQIPSAATHYSRGSTRYRFSG